MTAVKDMSVRPLPCPFCGSEYVEANFDPSCDCCGIPSGTVNCLDCNARVMHHASEASAIAGWNRRILATAPLPDGDYTRDNGDVVTVLGGMVRQVRRVQIRQAADTQGLATVAQRYVDHIKYHFPGGITTEELRRRSAIEAACRAASGLGRTP